MTVHSEKDRLIMAPRKNPIERALKKAQTVLGRYIKPGRKSAEATIEELMRVLADAREAIGGAPAKPRRGRPPGSRNRKTAAAAPANGRRKAVAPRKAAVGRPRKAAVKAKAKTPVKRAAASVGKTPRRTTRGRPRKA
jgi:hypothetical protein